MCISGERNPKLTFWQKNNFLQWILPIPVFFSNFQATRLLDISHLGRQITWHENARPWDFFLRPFLPGFWTNSPLKNLNPLNSCFWFPYIFFIQLAICATYIYIYITYILPIGWLDATYHLSGEPEASIHPPADFIPRAMRKTWKK